MPQTPSPIRSNLPAKSPLAGYPLMRSSDADEMRDFVGSIFCPHHLEADNRAGPMQAEINHAALGDASLNYLRYGVPVGIEPGELQSFFLVQVQLAGGIGVNSGRHSAMIGRDQASVLSPTEYVRMDWAEASEQLILRFERPAVERCLSTLLGRPLATPLVFDVLMDCRNGAAASWWRMVQFLRAELDQTDSLMKSPLAIKQFEQTLITTLLQSQRHNYSDALDREVSSAAPRHVKRVEDYIRANSHKDLTLEDLVAVSGVSARTLFVGFQRFRNTSPMKYLRQVRFERAHKDLLATAPDSGVTVTDIALKWGFSQLGRFAVEYRKFFGESPSDSLRRS